MATIKNRPAVLAKVAVFLQGKADSTKKGMRLAGESLLADSREIVPVDTGALSQSGQVRIVQSGGGSRWRAIVEYTIDYAIYVHENLDAAHGAQFNIKYAHLLKLGHKSGPYSHPRRPQERAKFLEEPFRQNYDKYMQIILANARQK